jgi:hypothetical protein
MLSRLAAELDGYKMRGRGRVSLAEGLPYLGQLRSILQKALATSASRGTADEGIRCGRVCERAYHSIRSGERKP